MTQSPNDVGAMHKILHQLFLSPSFRYEDIEEPTKKDWISLYLIGS